MEGARLERISVAGLSETVDLAGSSVSGGRRRCHDSSTFVRLFFPGSHTIAIIDLHVDKCFSWNVPRK